MDEDPLPMAFPAGNINHTLARFLSEVPQTPAHASSAPADWNVMHPHVFGLMDSIVNAVRDFQNENELGHNNVVRVMQDHGIWGRAEVCYRRI